MGECPVTHLPTHLHLLLPQVTHDSTWIRKRQLRASGSSSSRRDLGPATTVITNSSVPPGGEGRQLTSHLRERKTTELASHSFKVTQSLSGTGAQ